MGYSTKVKRCDNCVCKVILNEFVHNSIKANQSVHMYSCVDMLQKIGNLVKPDHDDIL